MKFGHPPHKTPTFLEFWVLITDHLGDSHGVIDPNTKTSQELFRSFNHQPGVLKDVISDSYVHNKCHHIKSPIDINSVLDILGNQAFELQLKQADDLLDIELLEEVCWVICQHYQPLIEMPQLNTQASRRLNGKQSESPKPTASVISLPKTKIRIANNKL